MSSTVNIDELFRSNYPYKTGSDGRYTGTIADVREYNRTLWLEALKLGKHGFNELVRQRHTKQFYYGPQLNGKKRDRLRLDGRNFAGYQFINAAMQGCYLANSNLTNTLWKNSNVHQANFNRANLQGAQFIDARIGNARFDHANLRQTTWQEIALHSYRTLWKEADLSEARFENCLLYGIKMQNVTAINTVFENCTIYDAYQAYTVFIAEYPHIETRFDYNDLVSESIWHIADGSHLKFIDCSFSHRVYSESEDCWRRVSDARVADFEGMITFVKKNHDVTVVLEDGRAYIQSSFGGKGQWLSLECDYWSLSELQSFALQDS